MPPPALQRASPLRTASTRLSGSHHSRPETAQSGSDCQGSAQTGWWSWMTGSLPTSTDPPSGGGDKPISPPAEKKAVQSTPRPSSTPPLACRSTPPATPEKDKDNPSHPHIPTLPARAAPMRDVSAVDRTSSARNKPPRAPNTATPTTGGAGNVSDAVADLLRAAKQGYESRKPADEGGSACRNSSSANLKRRSSVDRDQPPVTNRTVYGTPRTTAVPRFPKNEKVQSSPRPSASHVTPRGSSTSPQVASPIAAGMGPSHPVPKRSSGRRNSDAKDSPKAAKQKPADSKSGATPRESGTTPRETKTVPAQPSTLKFKSGVQVNLESPEQEDEKSAHHHDVPSGVLAARGADYPESSQTLRSSAKTKPRPKPPTEEDATITKIIQRANGELMGLRLESGSCRIREVLDGPAKRAQVRKGWVIVSVDGKSLGIDQQVQCIEALGRAGTVFQVTFRCDSSIPPPQW